MQVCLAVNGPKKNKHDQRIKEQAKVVSEEGLLLLCLNSVSELSILFNLFKCLTLLSNRLLIFLIKK
ncbi:hypothetical protein DKE47_011170 [Acinetobacter nosocomialis]|nr:hypothetical protein DKE47_011170 [Acinetobacter nosocomialis]